MEELVKILKKAVHAGNISLQKAKKELMCRHKGYKETVTNCDIASENAIINILKKDYPNSSFYSEEVGEISGEEDIIFIIDPVDGTYNLIHNLPLYAISIGVYKKGSPFAGVIYLPEFNAYYYAMKDVGAFCNNRRIQASGVLKLSNAMVAYDNQFHKHKSMLENLSPVIQSCFTMRIFGSACIDICYVANGNIDARIFHKTKIVDFASGIVIVEEAGGEVTDFSGKKPTLTTDNIIVSNGKIHKELIELLRLRE